MTNNQTDIQTLKAQLGQKALSQFQSGNFHQLAQTVVEICKTSVATEYEFDEPIVNALTINSGTASGYGENKKVWMLGKVYFQKWAQSDTTAKNIIPSCSKKGISVDMGVCGKCVECQRPKEFEDIIPLSRNQLCVQIPHERIRSQSCGIDTYNLILGAYDARIESARQELPYNCTLNILNDIQSYKNPQGETLTYCCNICEGQGLVQALVTLGKKIKKSQTGEYNKDGAVYRLPLSRQVLVVSDELDARLRTILGNTYNNSMVDLRQIFGEYYAVPLEIGDFVIFDKPWAEIETRFTNQTSINDPKERAVCVFVDHDFWQKAVNFRNAVFGKLNPVSCDDFTKIKSFELKIQTDTSVFTGNDEATVKPLVEAKVADIAKEFDPIKAETEISKFTAPTETVSGSVIADITFKDKNNVIVNQLTKVWEVKKAEFTIKNTGKATSKKTSTTKKPTETEVKPTETEVDTTETELKPTEQ